MLADIALTNEPMRGLLRVESAGGECSAVVVVLADTLPPLEVLSVILKRLALGFVRPSALATAPRVKPETPLAPPRRPTLLCPLPPWPKAAAPAALA